MTTSSISFTEEMVDVAGSRIKLIKGGSGDPLLILHDEMGHPGWLRYHQALAQDHTLYIPWHPGLWRVGRDGLGDEPPRPGRMVSRRPGRPGTGGRGCDGVLPGRLAGRRDGRHVPPAVPPPGPGRRRWRPPAHRRNLRHLPGRRQDLHHPMPAGPVRGRRVPANLPRRAVAGGRWKTGRRRWRVPAG